MITRKVFSAIEKIRNYLSPKTKTVAPERAFQDILIKENSKGENFSSTKITAETFNFMANEVMQNPHTYYETLRERGAIHFLPINNMWLFLNYHDVVAALKQPHIFSSKPMSVYEKVLLGADFAAHKNVRSLLAPYFAPQTVAGQAASIKKDVLDLLDELKQKSEFDAVEEFVDPLVERNIARFLNLQPEDYQELKNCLNGIDENIPHRYLEEFSVLRNFFGQYISAMRENEDDNLCLRLLRGNGDNKLSAEDTASVMTLLWIAGTKTTKEALGKAILRFLRDAEIRTLLENDLTLVTQYFEEVLRFEPPARAVYRQTVSDVEISNVKIPAGAKICLCLEAANHDAEVFPDPHRFDLRRNSKEHLAFGLGAHFCLGVHLGRLKAGIILEALIKNCPTLRLATTDENNFVDSPDYRPLKKLIVTARGDN